MEEVGRPFTHHDVRNLSQPSSTASASLIHLLPALLAAGWLCGFVMVFLLWHARWRRVAAAIQEAVPLREGREVEVLRRWSVREGYAIGSRCYRLGILLNQEFLA